MSRRKHSMSREERDAISRRMRFYWALRKGLDKAIEALKSGVIYFDPNTLVDARWIDSAVRNKDVCVVIQAKYVKQSEWVKLELEAAQ